MKVTVDAFRPIYPTPAALITSIAPDGRPNIITLGEVYNLSLRRPAVVGIGIHKARYSHGLISQTREYVVNLPTAGLLAKGLLTGKYTSHSVFKADDERSRFPRFQGETFARHLAVAERLEALARDKGLTLVQLAIAWVLRQPALTCALVGAKSPAQVEEHLGAVGVTFTQDELAQIDAILEDAPLG